MPDFIEEKDWSRDQLIDLLDVAAELIMDMTGYLAEAKAENSPQEFNERYDFFMSEVCGISNEAWADEYEYQTRQ